MVTEKEVFFPWGDGRSYALVSNGSEVFKAAIGNGVNPLKDIAIRVTWGHHVQGTQRFSGSFDRETGKFISVSLPNKRGQASIEEIAQWNVINGKYEDYKKVGARVRVYFVLKTIDSVIDALRYKADHKGELDSVMIRLQQGSDVYTPCHFSFLID